MLFSRLQLGGTETIITKKRRKKKTSILFYSQEISSFINQLKGQPLFSLKICFQKHIAIMTSCIKNQQTNKAFICSLKFFSMKGVLKNFINIHRKTVVPQSLF